jgi:DNA-binding CsgD family transcriptional regulator
LAVLTSGARNAPARQQTLRNTIKWSYDLLEAQEQQLFRWLSVFAGGCTLQAIESVCAALDHGAGRVLEGVTSLLDKSLVQQTEQEGGEPRLSMLETVREYGLERLQESREAPVSQRAHALYYLALAEEAEPHLKGAQQVLWWIRLEREQENLRAALAWLIEQEEGELALRLSGALWRFWYIRGYRSEGWRWLEAALGLPQAQRRTARRAKALFGAAELAIPRGPVARSLIEESMAIYRELGDRQGLAESFGGLGWALSKQDDVAAARTQHEESLALAREVGDPWILATVLYYMATFMYDHSDFKSARCFLEESVTLYRALKDSHMLSSSLRFLSDVVISEGNVTQAAQLVQESLALGRELNNRLDIIVALYWLAVTKVFQGNTEQAVALLEESLALAREVGDMEHIGDAQLMLGGLALQQGNLLQAETYVQESLSLFRELRSEDRAQALSLLGDIQRMKGDLTQAKANCKEGVMLANEGGVNYILGRSIISLARVVSDEGQLEQATRLFGVAETLVNPRLELDPFERADYERAVEDVRARLGERVFATAWTQGRTLSPEQVLAALEPAMMVTTSPTETSLTPSAKALTTYPDGLTAREVEVLRLVAQGLTDAQVAEHLVISRRTVNWHLTSIYSKLQVSSRSAATRYAMEQKLV